MRRIGKWLLNLFKSNGRNFLQFFLAFTGLFLILTAFIIQAVSSGLYRSTDDQIRKYMESPIRLVVAGYHLITGPDPSHGGANEALYDPSTNVLLYDKDGNLLNSGDQFYMEQIVSEALHFDRDKFLNSIQSVTVDNPYKGPDFKFRTSMMSFKFTQDAGGIPFTKVVYIQVLVNVTSLEDSLVRTRATVIIVMVIFWFLSLFAAMFLSRWSLKSLRTALDRQKAFVSNASHELRTPLAILQNRLELLFQKPDATIIDESENISASLMEVRNMKLLTTNLLEMAKSEGRVMIKPEQTDRKFFLDMFEGYAMLARDAQKVFTSEVTFEGFITIDKDLVKQVMTIFFDNAVKYTGEKGQIDISISKIGSQLQIIVADNGPGVSDLDKKKIFDRFYRVDEARTRGKGGLGLGLSLARELVTAMKGKITVEDNLPTGIKFTIKMKS